MHFSTAGVSQRWVLITGGGLRLGREFCLAFARAGWNVACHYLHSRGAAEATCAEVRALGRQALAFQADLSDRGAVSPLMAQAQAAASDQDPALAHASSRKVHGNSSQKMAIGNYRRK